MKKNNFKSLMQAAVLVCTPLVIASCDDVFGDADNPISSHLSVSQAPVNLELHADRPDAATFIRKGIAASGAQLVYSSTNEKVATVDEAGKITAVGEGDCKIIVKATGLDGNGKPTYQEAEDSFAVKVKDYRARIALKEGATVPIYNSARNAAGEKIDMTKLIDVWPALGTAATTTTPFTVAFSEVENESGGAPDPEGVINDTTDGQIELTGTPGKAKVVATITAVPTGFETTSFPKAQETDTLVVEVKEGVAYISYDEKGAPVTNYMFMNFNGEKVTDLRDVLYNKSTTAPYPYTTVKNNDVYLEAGWYYLKTDIAFNHNIRVKGNVNIILGQGKTLTMTAANTSIMDETMAKSYSLNFYKEAKTTGADGGIDITTIQDFKEVNFVDGTIGANTPVSLNKIGTVNINDGTFANLENIETLNFKKGTVNTKFNKIGTANISDGTFNCALDEVTTLNFKKGTAKKNLTKIGTATIEDGTFGNTTLAVPRIAIDGTTINIKKGNVYAKEIKAALIIDGGTVDVDASSAGTAITGNITMNDGTLTVVADNNGKQAIVGNVKVVKGTFTAQNDNYAAVSGTLTGKFQGSIDNGNTWTDITTETSSASRIKNVVPAP